MSQTKVSNTFIDNNFPFRNIVINGDMSISQRGDSTGVSGTDYYACDRFKYYEGDSAGEVTITQTADGPGVFGLSKCLKLACTTADTSVAASEYVFLQTSFETQHLQHLRKGESDAKKLYLSFYAKADASLTYVVEMYDNEHDRIQSQTFAVTTSWQRFTFEIPADTNGETLDNDNSAGVSIHWWLHGGSNYTSGTLSGSWANRNNTNRAAGAGSIFASTSRTFFLTGVQLELGGVSDFEQVPHDVQLQRCQRYYQQIPHTASASWQAYPLWGINANVMSTRLQLPVVMRSNPTGAFVGTRNTDFKAYYNGGYQTLTNEAVADTTDDAVRFDMYSSGAFAANDSGGLYINTTDGRITLTAEL